MSLLKDFPPGADIPALMSWHAINRCLAGHQLYQEQWTAGTSPVNRNRLPALLLDWDSRQLSVKPLRGSSSWLLTCWRHTSTRSVASHVLPPPLISIQTVPTVAAHVPQAAELSSWAAVPFLPSLLRKLLVLPQNHKCYDSEKNPSWEFLVWPPCCWHTYLDLETKTAAYEVLKNRAEDTQCCIPWWKSIKSCIYCVTRSKRQCSRESPKFINLSLCARHCSGDIIAAGIQRTMLSLVSFSDHKPAGEACERFNFIKLEFKAECLKD